MKFVFLTCISIVANASSTSTPIDIDNRVFPSQTYFDVVDKPALSNGHVTFVPFSDSIYMNGLFNGYRRTSSHRARIPNFANIYFESCGPARTADKSLCTYTLDTQQALFQTNANFFDGNVMVEHTQYAHRYFDRVIVNTIELRRKSTAVNGSCSFARDAMNTISVNFATSLSPLCLESFQMKLNRDWHGWSDDLKLGDVITGVIGRREVVLVAATTQTVEDPIYQNQTASVHILYEKIPKHIVIPSGRLSATFTWLTIIQHTADGIEELFQRLHRDHIYLLNTHTTEWSSFWEENAITARGNDELTKSIQSSLFAVASSLPSLKSFSSNGPFYGVARAGPQRDGYQGHSLCDSEMWILPAILLIEPKWAEKLLEYRHHVKDAARDNAQNTGHDGLR